VRGRVMRPDHVERMGDETLAERADAQKVEGETETRRQKL